MRTKLYFVAALVATLLASCADDKFVGDNSPNELQENAGVGINFGLEMPNITRSIGGMDAATKLDNNFYVAGTKGSEGTNNPSPDVVFNNYLVTYTANTAGQTESNTANWEYVNVTPDAKHVKLTPVATQTIKYWDYSTEQYDFLAFSTGTKKAVTTKNISDIADDEINVTAMKYGTDLASSATAYTFIVPNLSALENAFITDITDIKKSNYGKEVTLKFKNLGSKVRIALYETVPGYSIQAGSVQFYTVDGTTDFSGAKSTSAALISAETSSFATKGTIQVYFPNVGTSNASNKNHNKAATRVTSADGVTSKTFGTLANKANKQGSETEGALYLGRTLPEATFAGDVHKDYYEAVFPVSTGHPLTLRVDYTLISIDGQGETINVYGAKAVVPATYTVWQPNYAYTYIFKISDNTNGWTTPTGANDNNQGLYPITFDAVIAEFTDVDAEQTTVTTVSTPTITTYQQNHVYTTNEYSKTTGKDVYVQVMDNKTVPANLVTTLSTTNSLLYEVNNANATEAMVMDALEKRTTDIGAADVTGRNGIILTKSSHISNSVDMIINGVDDNPIDLRINKEDGTGHGKAAKLDMTNLTAGTYAYVYDYTASTKTVVNEYQPLAVTTGSDIGTPEQKHYASITATSVKNNGSLTIDDEDVDNNYIYFSRTTTDGGTTYSYSYISVVGKEKLPGGLVKVNKSYLTRNVDGATDAVTDTFYFDEFFSNNGTYAVKVIKVVD